MNTIEKIILQDNSAILPSKRNSDTPKSSHNLKFKIFLKYFNEYDFFERLLKALVVRQLMVVWFLA